MAGTRGDAWGPKSDWVATDPSSLDARTGTAAFRFSDDLARLVIATSSEVSDVVLDPFALDGSVIAVALELGRRAVGFESDPALARLARQRVGSPSLIHDGEPTPSAEIEHADLVLAAPPYLTFGGWDDNSMIAYWTDFDRIFRAVRALMHPGGRLVVHAANPPSASGQADPVAFRIAIALSDLFSFVGEIVCRPELPAQGATDRSVGHSFLLLFELPDRSPRELRDVRTGEYL